MFPRQIDGYLKFGSITSISLVNDVPATAPVTVFGWLVASATNGILLPLLFAAPMRVKSIPVLPYWFEIQTYGGRPAKMPTPPRICSVASPLRSQLTPTRGDHMELDGVMSVRYPKFATAAGLAVGVSG